MNTNDLKIFEAVAYNGSFKKAAEAMFTVQSNVTARIRVLEEEFGVTLFIRTSRKVELTDGGRKLMRYGKQIGQLLEEAKREMDGAGRLTGRLKIGCIETTMALKVPGILGKFADAYPDVELEFFSAMRGNLIADVLGHRLDAAFVSAPVNSMELRHVSVSQEHLVIVVPVGILSVGELVKKDPLKIVVFEQGCVFRERLESWLSAQGIVRYRSIVVKSIEGIINFVEGGLGCSILPEDIITRYYKGRALNTFSLNKDLATLRTMLVYRADAPPSEILQAFMAMFGTRKRK